MLRHAGHHAGSAAKFMARLTTNVGGGDCDWSIA